MKYISNESLTSLLQFLANGRIEICVNLEKIYYMYNDELDNDKHIGLLKNINNFLKTFLSSNNLALEIICQQIK